MVKGELWWVGRKGGGMVVGDLVGGFFLTDPPPGGVLFSFKSDCMVFSARDHWGALKKAQG